eukprot:jgi/Bigna1/79704/fgenesh1_pg.64_\
MRAARMMAAGAACLLLINILINGDSDRKAKGRVAYFPSKNNTSPLGRRQNLQDPWPPANNGGPSSRILLPQRPSSLNLLHRIPTQHCLVSLRGGLTPKQDEDHIEWDNEGHFITMVAKAAKSIEEKEGNTHSSHSSNRLRSSDYSCNNITADELKRFEDEFEDYISNCMQIVNTTERVRLDAAKYPKLTTGRRRKLKYFRHKIIGNLQKWLRENGVYWNASKLEIRSHVRGLSVCYVMLKIVTLCWVVFPIAVATTGLAIGVFAKADIVEGELIGRVPKKACLSVNTTSVSHILEAEGLRGQLGLIIAVLHEWTLEANSTWNPYFQALPRFHSIVSAFNPACLGTGLIQRADEDIQDLEDDFDSVVVPLVEKYNTTFNEEMFSLQNFKRAATWISSRAFQVDTDVGDGMVPFGDLFNHKLAVVDTEEYSLDGRSEMNDDQAIDGQSSIISPRPPESLELDGFGQEGHRQLYQQLLRYKYGFAMEGQNPYDTVFITKESFLDAMVEVYGTEYVIEAADYIRERTRLLDYDEAAPFELIIDRDNTTRNSTLGRYAVQAKSPQHPSQLMHISDSNAIMSMETRRLIYHIAERHIKGLSINVKSARDTSNLVISNSTGSQRAILASLIAQVDRSQGGDGQYASEKGVQTQESRNKDCEDCSMSEDGDDVVRDESDNKRFRSTQRGSVL